MRITMWVSLAAVVLLSWGSPLAAQQAPDLGTRSVANAFYQSDRYYQYQETTGPLSSSAEAEAVAYPAMPSDGQCCAEAQVDADGSLRGGSTIVAHLAYPQRSTNNYLRNVVSDGIAYQTTRYRVTSSNPLTTTVRIDATFHLHGRLIIDGFVGLDHKAEASVNVSARVWNSLNSSGGGDEGPPQDSFTFLYGSGSVEQWYFSSSTRTPRGLAVEAPRTIEGERYTYLIDSDLTGGFEAAPDTEITLQWTLATQALIWEATAQPVLSSTGLFLESDFVDGSTYGLQAYDPDHPEAVITLTLIPPPPEMSLLALPDELPSDGHFVGALEIQLGDAGSGLEGVAGTIIVDQTWGSGAVQVGPVTEVGGGLYRASLAGQTKGDVTLTVTETSTGAWRDLEVFVYTPGQDGRPVANAGTDQAVPEDEYGEALVTLNGSLSYDNEGPIASWRWFLNDEEIDTGQQVTVILETGVHRIVLIVEDAEGNVDMDEVQVTVGLAAPLEISETLDFIWVYQNTATATKDRHGCQLTVRIVSGGDESDTYVVSLRENDEPLTHFSAASLVGLDPDTPATVEVFGGRRDLVAAGTYTLNVTVVGLFSGREATVNVPLSLRLLGDIDGDGAITASDKLEMNKTLNGLAVLPGVTLRDLDLTGDGVTVDAEDKLVMNQVLNGLAVP